MMKIKSILLCIALIFCWVNLAAADTVTPTSVLNYVEATHGTQTASKSGSGNIYVQAPWTSSEAASAEASVDGYMASVGGWYVDASPCWLYAKATETWIFTAVSSEVLLDVAVVGFDGPNPPANDRVASWAIQIFNNTTNDPVPISSTDVVNLVPWVYEIWSGTALLAPGTEYKMYLSVEIGQTYESEPVESYYVKPTLTYGTTSVPEPATMLLLGFGLMGLAGLRRKM